MTEVHPLNEEIDLVPNMITKNLTDLSPEHYEFRPLTEEEKKKFVNSLDAQGKRVLAELTGKKARSSDSD